MTIFLFLFTEIKLLYHGTRYANSVCASIAPPINQIYRLFRIRNTSSICSQAFWLRGCGFQQKKGLNFHPYAGRDAFKRKFRRKKEGGRRRQQEKKRHRDKRICAVRCGARKHAR